MLVLALQKQLAGVEALIIIKPYQRSKPSLSAGRRF
jgi:hypothetical protein